MESQNDRCRVYVHCRPIFSGQYAHVRRLKKVTELVTQSKKSLKPLIRDIGKDKVIEIARSLLESRVFESELRAKVEFPELFRASPFRDAQRQASEIDAARSNAAALDEFASGSEEEEEDLDDSGEGSEPDNIVEEQIVKMVVESAIQEDNLDSAVGSAESSTGTRGVQDKLPSLYPSYLPYHAQHLILNTAQKVLEECCFDFAASSMPSVLEHRNWDCPEAAELTEWTKILRRRKVRVQALTPDVAAAETHRVFTMIARLRHTAVHRLLTTARGVSEFLESAVNMAQMLKDGVRAAQLEELWSDVNSKIKAMELNKNLLEDTAFNQLKEIQRKREELDRMEAEAIQGMLKEDAVNKVFVGQLLEDSVRGIFYQETSEKKGFDDVIERQETQVEAEGDKTELDPGGDAKTACPPEEHREDGCEAAKPKC